MQRRAPLSGPFFYFVSPFRWQALCRTFVCPHPPGDQLPKNTLQYDAGPLHCAGEAAWATPEAAANSATEAIRAERMRFMVLLLFSVWFAIWCDRWTEE